MIIRRGGYAALLFGWVNSERPFVICKYKAVSKQISLGFDHWSGELELILSFGVSPTHDARQIIMCLLVGGFIAGPHKKHGTKIRNNQKVIRSQIPFGVSFFMFLSLFRDMD